MGFTVEVRNGSGADVACRVSHEVFRRSVVPRNKEEGFVSNWHWLQRVREVGVEKAGAERGGVLVTKSEAKILEDLNSEYSWVDGGVQEVTAPAGESATASVSLGADEGYYVLGYRVTNRATGAVVMPPVRDIPFGSYFRQAKTGGASINSRMALHPEQDPKVRDLYTERRKQGFRILSHYTNLGPALFPNVRFYSDEHLSRVRGLHGLCKKHRIIGVHYCGYSLPPGIPENDTFGNEMRQEPPSRGCTTTPARSWATGCTAPSLHIRDQAAVVIARPRKAKAFRSVALTRRPRGRGRPRPWGHHQDANSSPGCRALGGSRRWRDRRAWGRRRRSGGPGRSSRGSP